MVLKGIEYNVKFHHQAVRLKDYTVIEGHLGYEMEDGKPVLDHNGNKIEENLIFIETSKLTFNTVVSTNRGLRNSSPRPNTTSRRSCSPRMSRAVTKEGQPAEVLAKAGEAALRRTAQPDSESPSRRPQPQRRPSHRGLARGMEERQGREPRQEAAGRSLPASTSTWPRSQPKLLTEISTVAFNVDPPARFDFNPRDIKEADGQSRLRDDTVVDGKLLDSPMVFHYVDAIDFQHLAMKAVEKGHGSRSWRSRIPGWSRTTRSPRKRGNGTRRRSPRSRSVSSRTTASTRRPASRTASRPPRSAIASAGRTSSPRRTAWIASKEKIADQGGVHGAGLRRSRGEAHLPALSVPREQVGFAAKFTPAWNTYYAIYFTITGLHGLHVIGGALVLAYYLFFGRKMYLNQSRVACQPRRNRRPVLALRGPCLDLRFPDPLFDVSLRFQSQILKLQIHMADTPEAIRNPSAPTCSSAASCSLAPSSRCWWRPCPRLMSGSHGFDAMGLPSSVLPSPRPRPRWLPPSSCTLITRRRRFTGSSVPGLCMVCSLVGLTALAMCDPIHDPLFYGKESTTPLSWPLRRSADTSNPTVHPPCHSKDSTSSS